MEEKQLEIESKSSMEFSLYEVIKRLIDVVCSSMLVPPFFLTVSIYLKTIYIVIIYKLQKYKIIIAHIFKVLIFHFHNSNNIYFYYYQQHEVVCL